MNVLPFVGARRKLEWSKHHITDLSRKMGAFFADGAYRYVVVDDPASGQRVMRVERKKPIPDQWGLLLGDAIHSARAALDLMTWEVMKPLNVHPSSAVQFPIGNDRNHYFKQMIPNRKINLAPKSVCNAFYNLEAYPGGDGALLHTLHHLDVLDKHQIIVPAVQAAVLSNFTAKDIDPSYRLPGRNNVQNSFFTGELSRLAFWPVHQASTPIYEVNRRLKKHLRGKTPFTVLFGSEAGSLAGQPIIPALVSMAERVEWALDIVGKASV